MRRRPERAGLKPLKQPVAAIMSTQVRTIRADMSVGAAVDVMLSAEIGHLPVLSEDGSLVGIVSKTDLVREHFLDGDTDTTDAKVQTKAGVRYWPGPGFHEDGEARRTVSDVMSTQVRTVRDDATIAEAATLMAKHRVHGLPVVSRRNMLVGFVSTFDVVDWVAG